MRNLLLRANSKAVCLTCHSIFKLRILEVQVMCQNGSQKSEVSYNKAKFGEEDRIQVWTFR